MRVILTLKREQIILKLDSIYTTVSKDGKIQRILYTKDVVFFFSIGFFYWISYPVRFYEAYSRWLFNGSVMNNISRCSLISYRLISLIQYVLYMKMS
jgi:hypothetical protein